MADKNHADMMEFSWNRSKIIFSGDWFFDHDFFFKFRTLCHSNISKNQRLRASEQLHGWFRFRFVYLPLTFPSQYSWWIRQVYLVYSLLVWSNGFGSDAFALSPANRYIIARALLECLSSIFGELNFRVFLVSLIRPDLSEFCFPFPSSDCVL